jgi:hypothetical protein
MKEIKDLTQKDLFHIANLATGGYFNSEWSKDHKEVEVGGYDKRRRVIWTQNTEGYDEEDYFEISAENPDGWAWHCKARYKGDWQLVNTIAPHRIIDYLRENNFNVENEKLHKS